MMQKVYLFTDGSYSTLPHGIGTYAYVFNTRLKGEIAHCGTVEHCLDPCIAEATAILYGVQAIKRVYHGTKTHIVINSDHLGSLQYLSKGVRKPITRKMSTIQKKHIQILNDVLNELSKYPFSLRYVKSHVTLDNSSASHIYHRKCDKMAINTRKAVEKIYKQSIDLIRQWV